jgi:hypothetical protein
VLGRAVQRGVRPGRLVRGLLLTQLAPGDHLSTWALTPPSSRRSVTGSARPSSAARCVVGRSGRPPGLRNSLKCPTPGFDARCGARGEHDDSRRRPRPQLRSR